MMGPVYKMPDSFLEDVAVYRIGQTSKAALARRYKVHKDVINRWLNEVENGPKAQLVPEPQEELATVINLPEVNLLHYKAAPPVGDEEEVVLVTSDGHAGKITKSFNKEVYIERMHKVFESTMEIVQLHRHMYPLRKLHICNLGDNIQGENPFQGSKIGEVSMGARDQVIKIAVPTWNDVIGSFRQEFEVVNFDGVPGNHGASKIAPETSKEDLRLFDILKAGIGREDGINIRPHENFETVIDICGFKFFLLHGDGIPCQQGVPFFALAKKLKAWYIQFGGFDYALSGHFHKRHCDEVASKFEYFMCGTLVSDDEWALKKLGISSLPSQWLLGVHPRHGVTWRYPLTVDDKFLPGAINDNTG